MFVTFLLFLVVVVLLLLSTVIIDGAIGGGGGGSGGGGAGPTTTRSATLSWAAQAVGNDIAPGTDTAVDCRAGSQLLVDCDASSLAGTTTVDFKIIASVTSATAGFGDSTNPYVEVVTALATGARVVRAITSPGGWVRGRIDINTATSSAATTMGILVVET